MMDEIDFLGERPERRKAFSRELLAEAEDEVLQGIVERAARDLDTPIALVTMVLDQIQFFKAHHGLPEDLKASRCTARNVSFCQFVVGKGETIEINDASNNPELPQTVVKSRDFKAYLGVPLRVGEIVVGSLCVIDRRSRNFSQEERRTLERLAVEVNERVVALAEGRRQVRLSLSDDISGPGVVELRTALLPVRECVDEARLATVHLQSCLRLAEYQSQGGLVAKETMQGSLAQAEEALVTLERLLAEIEAAAADGEDCVAALEALTQPSGRPELSVVLFAAQDLSRKCCEAVGGMYLRDLPDEIVLSTPRPLAVAVLTSCITRVANHLAEAGDRNGVQLAVTTEEDWVRLAIGSPRLPQGACEGIAGSLKTQLSGDPSIRVQSSGRTVDLLLSVSTKEERS